MRTPMKLRKTVPAQVQAPVPQPEAEAAAQRPVAADIQQQRTLGNQAVLRRLGGGGETPVGPAQHVPASCRTLGSHAQRLPQTSSFRVPGAYDGPYPIDPPGGIFFCVTQPHLSISIEANWVEQTEGPRRSPRSPRYSLSFRGTTPVSTGPLAPGERHQLNFRALSPGSYLLMLSIPSPQCHRVLEGQVTVSESA